MWLHTSRVPKLPTTNECGAAGKTGIDMKVCWAHMDFSVATLPTLLEAGLQAGQACVGKHGEQCFGMSHHRCVGKKPIVMLHADFNVRLGQNGSCGSQHVMIAG